MRKCVFSACRKRPPAKSGRMSYHNFPRSQEQMLYWVLWVQEECGKHDFKLHFSSTLCSRHFAESCFRITGRLFSNAVPSITPEDLDEAEKLMRKESDTLVRHETKREERKQKIRRIQKHEEPNIQPTPNSDTPCTTVNISEDKEQASTASLPAPMSDSPCTSLNISEDQEQAPTASQPAVVLKRHQEATNILVDHPDNGERSIKTLKKKIRKRIPRDLPQEKFENSSSKAEQNLSMGKVALRKIRKRFHAQAKKIRAVKKSVLGIKQLVENLRKSNSLTGEGESELHVAVGLLLNHVNCKEPL